MLDRDQKEISTRANVSLFMSCFFSWRMRVPTHRKPPTDKLWFLHFIYFFNSKLLHWQEKTCVQSLSHLLSTRGQRARRMSTSWWLQTGSLWIEGWYWLASAFGIKTGFFLNMMQGEEYIPTWLFLLSGEHALKWESKMKIQWWRSTWSYFLFTLTKTDQMYTSGLRTKNKDINNVAIEQLFGVAKWRRQCFKSLGKFQFPPIQITVILYFVIVFNDSWGWCYTCDALFLHS